MRCGWCYAEGGHHTGCPETVKNPADKVDMLVRWNQGYTSGWNHLERTPEELNDATFRLGAGAGSVAFDEWYNCDR